MNGEPRAAPRESSSRRPTDPVNRVQSSLTPNGASGDRIVETHLNGKAIAFVCALLPTLDGLCQMTILAGVKGRVRFAFHATRTADFQALLADLNHRFP